MNFHGFTDSSGELVTLYFQNHGGGCFDIVAQLIINTTVFAVSIQIYQLSL